MLQNRLNHTGTQSILKYENPCDVHSNVFIWDDCNDCLSHYTIIVPDQRPSIPHMPFWCIKKSDILTLYLHRKLGVKVGNAHRNLAKYKYFKRRVVYARLRSFKQRSSGSHCRRHYGTCNDYSLVWSCTCDSSMEIVAFTIDVTYGITLPIDVANRPSRPSKDQNKILINLLSPYAHIHSQLMARTPR